MEAYNLTHEVFVPYKFGENLDADFFTPDDKTYLQGVFENLIPWYIQKRKRIYCQSLFSAYFISR